VDVSSTKKKQGIKGKEYRDITSEKGGERDFDQLRRNKRGETRRRKGKRRRGPGETAKARRGGENVCQMGVCSAKES